ALVDNGLTDYYRHRTTSAQQGESLIPEELADMQLYDRDDLQQSFVRETGGEEREASLILEGIVCAACVWLNERHVKSLPGVVDFQVNYSTHRARVSWDNKQIHLSGILKAIHAIGYQAHPFDPGRQEQVFKTEKIRALRRLAVAGLGMVQVMMFAVALYAGEGDGMSNDVRQFLRWISLLLTTPVVLFAAKPFFTSAWRDLKRFQLGMDVPVSLAIGGAYLASTWATFTGHGDVYFDSVNMFTFFLLTGRYLEMTARHRAGQAAEELVKLLPATATRLDDNGEQRVPVAELGLGDRVVIKPGESVPADGMIINGISLVDESLLTGESLPVRRQVGMQLTGGTLNTESPLIMRVDKLGEDTVLSSIVRLLDRAQSEKPSLAKLADKVAGWFVAALLIIATGVALWWWQYDPQQAFRVTLSVLVVTCPCALSLATPAALTAATGALTRLGVLTTRGHALETLARVTHMIFDKTGTLTEGRLQVADTLLLGDKNEEACLHIAASLEQFSEHPVAQALLNTVTARLPIIGSISTPGRGIEGHIKGLRYRIGTADYVAEITGPIEPKTSVTTAHTQVYLGSDNHCLAIFSLADNLRSNARDTLRDLNELDIQTELLSGDQTEAVQAIAEQAGIKTMLARCQPQDKLDHIRKLQQQDAVVAMIGDGINDAPVLAGAEVSVAMGGGTQLAHASADMVLLSEQLPHLVDAVKMARRTRRVIGQNLLWALVYNSVALPLAAAGWISPWMAAFGMSASSLVVVLNALRLRNTGV
ncbi:MAG: heavy metal translocating P-type ATPase, partial [Gammaproteobacteria bacterium]